MRSYECYPSLISRAIHRCCRAVFSVEPAAYCTPKHQPSPRRLPRGPQAGIGVAQTTRSLLHQLLIHVDYEPAPGGLEIRYSYPFSRPHELREQVIRIPRKDIPEKLRVELDTIVQALADRIPAPDPARLPHAEFVPEIRRAIATVVIQDQRPNRTPLARMYYHEEIKEIGSRIEQQVRMNPQDFSDRVKESWWRLRAAIKGIAWKDYKRLVRAGLFPERPARRRPNG